MCTMELPSLHLLSLLDPTEMPSRAREEDASDSDDDVPLSQRPRIDPAAPRPVPIPQFAIAPYPYGKAALQEDAKFYNRERAIGAGDDFFSAAAKLVAYACERILYANDGRLTAEIQMALEHIFGTADSVYKNLLSQRWVRKPAANPNFLQYLGNAITMKYERVGYFRDAPRCQACGQKNELTMYDISMTGWNSEAYQRFAPSVPRWNVYSLVHVPEENKARFQQFFDEYMSQTPEENRGFFRRTYRVGSICAALCSHAMIAKSFFVEGMYECKRVQNEREKLELGALRPEDLNTYQPRDAERGSSRSSSSSSGGDENFSERMPETLRSIRKASRAGDGRDLRERVGMPDHDLVPYDDRFE